MFRTPWIRFVKPDPASAPPVTIAPRNVIDPKQAGRGNVSREAARRSRGGTLTG
jgi:hypothetical protein